MTEKRDFRGYAGRPPHAKWPGEARVALSIVLNIEEGAELTLGAGDARNESVHEVLSEIQGTRDLCMESHFEYGSRAGYWRIVELLDEFGLTCTANCCARGLETTPWIATDIVTRGFDVMCHGYRWQQHAGLEENAFSQSPQMEISMKALKTFICALALSAASFTACAAEWIMASGYPDSNFMTQNIREFIEEVEGASGGELKITLHSNDTLIKLDNIRRAVQKGQVQLGEIRLGVYSNEDPMYALAGLPFIAPDYDSAWKLMEAQAPYFDNVMGGLGIKVLAYQPWPGQGFYTKFKVNSTDDFKGKKLRIYSRPTQDMGNMLGFESTILPFAEIPQAFATGLIEALFTSPQTGIDIQAWDNTDHFTLAGAIYSKNAIIVNQGAFDALTPELQATVMQAGAAATKRGWEKSAATLDEQMGMLAGKGMNVEQAPQQVIDEMIKIGEEMMDNWRKDASPEANAVLDSYLGSM